MCELGIGEQHQHQTITNTVTDTNSNIKINLGDGTDFGEVDLGDDERTLETRTLEILPPPQPSYAALTSCFLLRFCVSAQVYRALVHLPPRALIVLSVAKRWVA